MVNSGEKLNIPATVWNDLLNMLGWWKGGGLNQLTSELRTAYPPTIVWVKNTTISHRAAFEVLEINDTIADVRLFAQEKFKSLHLDGRNISNPLDSLYSYAVLQEPASANGGFARAVISGLTLCKLNITHAQDKYCDLAAGVPQTLKTGPLGTSRIILKNSGTGSDDKWGVIRVGHHSGQILVKNEGSPIAGGASGDGSVIKPSDFSLTGQVFTVKNASGVSWATDKRGSAELIDGVACVSPQESP